MLEYNTIFTTQELHFINKLLTDIVSFDYKSQDGKNSKVTGTLNVCLTEIGPERINVLKKLFNSEKDFLSVLDTIYVADKVIKYFDVDEDGVRQIDISQIVIN